MASTATFTVEVIGETTGEKWHGAFTTKLRLSHADQFRQDEIRRKLLGTNPERPSPRAANAAEVFSFIAIHLIDAPQWWKGNGNGLDLEDDNVVAKVYDSIMAEKVKDAEETAKKVEAAKGELKKIEPPK